MNLFDRELLNERARVAAEEDADFPLTGRPSGKPVGQREMILSSEWLAEVARRAQAEELDLPPTGRPTGKRISVEKITHEAVRLPSPLLEQVRALWEARKQKGRKESFEEFCALLLSQAAAAQKDNAEEGTQAP